MKQSPFTLTTAAHCFVLQACIALLEIEHFGIIMSQCYEAMSRCLKGITSLY